ncbi:MAG: LPP20 family lipoprotein, partial [Nitrospirota bacterium]
AAGKIRAAGGVSPPANAENAAQARAMTQRAAIADGQRNLLRTIQQIRIDGGRSVGALMQNRNMAERIQGFVKGYTVVSERQLEDGRIEVLLELPLTGPSGLSRYIVEHP